MAIPGIQLLRAPATTAAVTTTTASAAGRGSDGRKTCCHDLYLSKYSHCDHTRNNRTSTTSACAVYLRADIYPVRDWTYSYTELEETTNIQGLVRKRAYVPLIESSVPSVEYCLQCVT